MGELNGQYHRHGQLPEPLRLPVGQPVTYASWLARVHPEDRDKLRCDVDQILRSGNDYYQEFRVHHPKRGERWIRAKAALNATLPAPRCVSSASTWTSPSARWPSSRSRSSFRWPKTAGVHRHVRHELCPVYANHSALKIVGLGASATRRNASPSILFSRGSGFHHQRILARASVRVGPKWKSASGISRPASQCG